ncbi:MAG: LemA family protein [Desulfobacterales bacterium]|nr:LemA family protein [Desulfobacterales bacterium]
MNVLSIGQIVLIITGLVCVILVYYAIMIYNSLVMLKNNIDKAWSNIDVLLKQRFDELPKLVSVCEGYMQHERKTLELVTKARSMLETASTDKEKMKAQNAITESLRSLFAVVEQYPDLKADQAFRRLGMRISELEDQIADRREMVNESANLYNIRIEQFPDIIIARFFNYQSRTLWEIEPSDRQDVSIRFASS